ncbi:MAG: UDP binding domain-containing protein, partial [Salinimicrobium sp.]
FKENCPDVRNTKVVDVVKHLKEYGTNVTIYDPLADPAEVQHEYGLETLNEIPDAKFDSVVLAVAHKEFLEMDLDRFKNGQTVIYDVKGVLKSKCDKKL